MNERFENVWDAIEDTPAQAENKKLRSTLMIALQDHIAQTGLSQSQAPQDIRCHAAADFGLGARTHRSLCDR